MKRSSKHGGKHAAFRWWGEQKQDSELHTWKLSSICIADGSFLPPPRLLELFPPPLPLPPPRALAPPVHDFEAPSSALTRD
jgi:hypothetical protein